MKFNKKGNYVSYGLLILVFLSLNSSLIGNTNSTESLFSDNFDDGIIDSIWTMVNKSQSYVIEDNGSIHGINVPDDNSFMFTYLTKSINSDVKSIKVDFNYSMLGMGRIYLMGTEFNNSIKRWQIGIDDAWSGSNANARIHLVDENENVIGSKSWETSISPSNGTGTIFVEFISETKLKFDFVYPGGNKTFETDFEDSTNYIRLFFELPPINFYNPNDYWMIDNYIEFGNISNTISTTIPNTSNTSEEDSTSKTESSENTQQSNSSMTTSRTSNIIITEDLSLDLYYVLLSFGIIIVITLRRNKI